MRAGLAELRPGGIAPAPGGRLVLPERLLVPAHPGKRIGLAELRPGGIAPAPGGRLVLPERLLVPAHPGKRIGKTEPCLGAAAVDGCGRPKALGRPAVLLPSVLGPAPL